MVHVKVQIYRGKDFNDKDLINTKYLKVDTEKKLTAKKAGQLLANNFPEFDSSMTRDGLQKSDKGFLAMRTFTPTEKCDYHYIWEYALVTEDAE